MSADTWIVVVTFNGAPWISRCLESIYCDSNLSTVVVVDNNSSDNTCDIVRGRFPQVKLVKVGANLGFGAGNNIGISRAVADGAKYIFLLNQDAYLTPGCVDILECFMSRHRDFGICSPLHCSPDLDKIDIRTMRGYLARTGQEYISDACSYSVKSHYTIGGVNAAAWFVRAEVFAHYGGFNPIFFMYGEDDDLLQRWSYHGVKFALLPTCKIVHLRESAIRAKGTLFQEIWRRSERPRSMVLARMLRPNLSILYVIRILIAEAWIRPIIDILHDGDVKAGLTAYVAALRLTGALPSVINSVRLSTLRGPHFLFSVHRAEQSD